MSQTNLESRSYESISPLAATSAAWLPDLQIGIETPWPMLRDGKQVYAKLIDFGSLPAAFGLRSVSHGVQNIEWKQIAWEHSIIARSTDANQLTLQAASSPAISGGQMPWRFAVDRTSVQCNITLNVDYRDWNVVRICLLYTKADDTLVSSGFFVQPGPDGATLVSRGGTLVWENQGASSGGYELCEFYYFRHPTLRPGFQAAQGEILVNAAALYPQAWAYLQTAEGQMLCKTEAEWQAMTTATWATLADGSKVGWNGIGGAPYYVQDLAAGTLRLPDLRGMYAEAAGFDSLGVGGVHGDAIRNITGSCVIHYYYGAAR